jgi:hypothetical protein
MDDADVSTAPTLETVEPWRVARALRQCESLRLALQVRAPCRRTV